MTQKMLIAKILVIAGTLLTLFPVVAMLGTSLFHLISTGTFLMDYLLPAELALFGFSGILLVIWASFLSRDFQKPIIGCAIAIAILLGAGLLYVQLSGLGSSESDPTPLVIGFAIGIMVVYSLLLVAIGVFGIFMAIRLFKKKE